MFDKEEWKILPAKEKAVYAGVLSNEVVVEPTGSKPYFVYIVIPSDLFSFLKDGLNIPSIVMATDSPQLCLYEHGGGWVFSMYMADSEEEENYDFWQYTKLPLWALRHPR